MGRGSGQGQWAGEPGEAGRVERSWKNLQLATTMVDVDRRDVNCASEAIMTGAAMPSAYVDNGSDKDDERGESVRGRMLTGRDRKTPVCHFVDGVCR